MRNKLKQTAFSIVELMISIFIGLIILTGLITIFETTSRMNKTQNGLARLQENGRFITVQLKHVLDQAAYQYCFSSRPIGAEESITPPVSPDPSAEFIGSPSRQTVWNVYTSDAIFPGVPEETIFDPRFLIHGHECSTDPCLPNFTSDGSDTSFTIPLVGTGDGNRIAGTDVLTVRYLEGAGREVANIVPAPASATTQTLNYTPFAIANNPRFPLTNSQVLIAGCGSTQHAVVDLTIGNANSATFTIPSRSDWAGLRGGDYDLTKVFDIQTDMRSVTYYVANNVVNDRDVPTLYSVNNGTVNALIEGVDRFDILYGVQTSTPGNIIILDAGGVENMPAASCPPAPSTGGIPEVLTNGVGCGWRSIVSIEYHLLLNTVHNSSTREDEVFFYSIDGDQAQTASDLSSGINHYSLHRKEFFSVVTTKNYN